MRQMNFAESDSGLNHIVLQSGRSEAETECGVTLNLDDTTVKSLSANGVTVPDEEDRCSRCSWGDILEQLGLG